MERRLLLFRAELAKNGEVHTRIRIPGLIIQKTLQLKTITIIAGWLGLAGDIFLTLSLRNVHKDVDGPWCYTTDPNKEWEVCFTSMSSDSKIDGN